MLGEALVEPQKARVVLLGVVEGAKGAVADALDVPGVEELVRGQLGEALVALFVFEGQSSDVQGT